MTKPAVPASAALSIQAPQKLIARATSVTPESIDMAAWIAIDTTFANVRGGSERYVTVTAEDADLYVLVSATEAAGAGTIDGTFNSAAASAASAHAKIPMLIPAGQSRDFVLDREFQFLHHVAKAGTGRIRVQRS